MPMVGKMEFPYTAKGYKAAAAASKKTGKKMVKKTVMKKMPKIMITIHRVRNLTQNKNYAKVLSLL